MIAFTTLIYCLGIVVFFKVMKVAPNPKNVAGATVIGFVLIGAIVILWKFSSPTSSNLVVSRYTIQLVPQVKGPIKKIHAEPNVPLKKGKDVLFEILPDTYEFAVSQFEASLSAAKKNVEQNRASIKSAEAGTKKSVAELAAAKAELDVALETRRINASAISALRITQLEEQYNAKQASLEQAKSSEEEAKFTFQSSESSVVALQAQLSNAKFNLEQCTVYAPADGFVTNWQAREGTMAVSMPFAPVGMFVDTSRVNLVATFGQNVLKNVSPGDPVEISLKTKPGRVFTGTVEAVIQASSDGQFVTSGQLMSNSDIQSDGLFAVKFILDDEETTKELAMGTAGTVVIYTDNGKPFHMISKVVVRMNAWMYYLNPF